MGILGELRAATRIGKHIANGRSVFDLAEEGPGGGITGGSFATRTIEWIARPYLLSVERQLIEDLGALTADLERPRYRRPDLPEPPQTGIIPDLVGVLWGVQLPALRHVVLRSDLWSARTALTSSALALRSYRVDRGVYPDRLEALVPEYLEQLPLDPFKGEPPSYRREGSGFVLASAGDDPRYDAGPQYPRDLTWHLPL
jgi:hypothetical protein